MRPALWSDVAAVQCSRYQQRYCYMLHVHVWKFSGVWRVHCSCGRVAVGGLLIEVLRKDARHSHRSRVLWSCALKSRLMGSRCSLRINR